MGTWRRPTLVPGIYDEILSERLEIELRRIAPDEFEVVREEVDPSSPLLAPTATLLREALDLALSAHEKDSAKSLALAREVLTVLHQHVPGTFQLEELSLQLSKLTAIVARNQRSPSRPLGSLHASSLLVNARDASLLEHLRSEFDSADQIDLLCSFVKVSGFEKLRDLLERHCIERGRTLRVLTTTYMGATDAKAVERLAKLPNAEVRVSYDRDSTRLHAKAWIFHRHTGLSTAYVGSSNLSHAAQTEGLEWNIRITANDQPNVLAQMSETFEQYWSDPVLFEPFRSDLPAHRERLARSLQQNVAAADPTNVVFDLDPKPFQTEVLKELERARALGRHRNLVVAATGTGKTVMAALDYRRLSSASPRQVETLLFVAHRREILEQARATFGSVMGSHQFGDLLVEGSSVRDGRHVFASIDSLRDETTLDVSRFDMVIVDEAHHTAADTWTVLLERVRPKELLGLTGTPERADGLDYGRFFPRPWVGNLRVWNAIPEALVPFRYYVLDVEGVDLRDVAWTNGKYAPDALAGKLVGASEAFVRRAVRAVAEAIARPDELRAIAFCANVRHAEEVARQFRVHGYRSEVLTGKTETEVRREARAELNSGRVQILCVVGIYNEGVDVPQVNTLFFFRPTESATVFLQQLGRGLRRAFGKAELVVFDLTGRQHLEFRFDRRLRELLGTTPRELRELVSNGFGPLPAGCHIHFDELARKDVLDQLERAIPSDITAIRELLRSPAHASQSLHEFLESTEVDLGLIYRSGRSWTELRRACGLEERPLAPGEEKALRNAQKLSHVGDPERLEAWARMLKLEQPTSVREQRLCNMLFAVLYDRKLAADGAAAWDLWAGHPLLREEVAQLIPVLAERNALLLRQERLEPDVPLVPHARYLGVELSAAFDDRTEAGAFRDYYTGVEPVADGRYDLLLVTLEKSAAQKEHLKYRDFPLNAERFHWQSKEKTTRASRPGQRHLDPSGSGCTPLLLVRERADDRPGVTMAFRYLGPVRPVKAEGERPITIEWALEYPMPGDLLRFGRIAA